MSAEGEQFSAETSNVYEKEWKRFQVLIRLLLVAVILLVLLYSFITAIGEKLLPNIFFVLRSGPFSLFLTFS